MYIVYFNFYSLVNKKKLNGLLGVNSDSQSQIWVQFVTVQEKMRNRIVGKKEKKNIKELQMGGSYRLHSEDIILVFAEIVLVPYVYNRTVRVAFMSSMMKSQSESGC